MDDYIPHVAANDQALAYWKDPNNFGSYHPEIAQIKKEQKRQRRFTAFLFAQNIINSVKVW